MVVVVVGVPRGPHLRLLPSRFAAGFPCKGFPRMEIHMEVTGVIDPMMETFITRNMVDGEQVENPPAMSFMIHLFILTLLLLSNTIA